MIMIPIIGFISIFHSLQYVKDKSIQYNIDDSHNWKHSFAVFKEGRYLLEHQSKNYNQKSKQIVYLGCILHDMCDHKYMNVTSGLQEIHNFLNKTVHDEEIVNGVMTIIPRISYSKTVKNNSFQLPQELLNYSHIDEYHMIRHSDLLTGYNLFRPIEMRYEELIRNNKTINMNVILDESEQVINNRIFKMLDYNLFCERFAKQKAIKYHRLAKYKYTQWKNVNITDYHILRKILN